MPGCWRPAAVSTSPTTSPTPAGVIDFHQERIDDRPEAVMRAVGRIFPITLEVLEQARAAGRTPLAVAEEVVAGRLAAARASRPAA
jgi:hypothetical protein